MFQRHHERLVVGRGDAKLRSRHLAGVHGFRVLDQVQVVGVGGCGLRIENAPPGEHEIARRHRLPVRPLMIAQMERPGQPVGRCFPTSAAPGIGSPFASSVVRPMQHVADDVVLPVPLDEVRIEGSRLRSVAAVQHDLAGLCPGSRRPVRLRAVAAGGEGAQCRCADSEAERLQDRTPTHALTFRSTANACGWCWTHSSPSPSHKAAPD